MQILFYLLHNYFIAFRLHKYTLHNSSVCLQFCGENINLNVIKAAHALAVR